MVTVAQKPRVRNTLTEHPLAYGGENHHALSGSASHTVQAEQ